MTDRRIEHIVEDLIKVMPLMHRKLLRMELEHAGITHQHLAIMGILEKCGTLPVSGISRQLGFSKSQMTHFIDKLITLGLVTREPDARDRRVIQIRITEKGQAELHRYVGLIRRRTAHRLNQLSESELDELARSLRTLRTLVEKLE